MLDLESNPVRPNDAHARKLAVRDLAVHFPVTEGLLRRHVGAVRAVDGIDLDVGVGETVGIVGESGCGKSTMGRAVIQLVKPTAGSVTLDGVELTQLDTNQMRRMRRRIQMVFQDPYSSLDPRMTVGRTIAEPLEVHDLARGRGRADRVRELMRIVGLDPSVADRYPHEFSGGQRQRVGIARALAVEPDVIVADEPVSALDVSIQAQVINLFAELQSKFGLSYIFISHDLGVVRHISDRVAVMYLGRIVETAPKKSLYARPLHPYSQALLSAVPVPDPEAEAHRTRIILGGDVPSPVNPPSGCHFHPRCPLRKRLGNPDVCTSVSPDLVEYEPTHFASCHFAGDQALQPSS